MWDGYFLLISFSSPSPHGTLKSRLFRSFHLNSIISDYVIKMEEGNPLGTKSCMKFNSTLCACLGNLCIYKISSSVLDIACSIILASHESKTVL